MSNDNRIDLQIAAMRVKAEKENRDKAERLKFISERASRADETSPVTDVRDGPIADASRRGGRYHDTSVATCAG